MGNTDTPKGGHDELDDLLDASSEGAPLAAGVPDPDATIRPEDVPDAPAALRGASKNDGLPDISDGLPAGMPRRRRRGAAPQPPAASSLAIPGGLGNRFGNRGQGLDSGASALPPVPPVDNDGLSGTSDGLPAGMPKWKGRSAAPPPPAPDTRGDDSALPTDGSLGSGNLPLPAAQRGGTIVAEAAGPAASLPPAWRGETVESDGSGPVGSAPATPEVDGDDWINDILESSNRSSANPDDDDDALGGWDDRSPRRRYRKMALAVLLVAGIGAVDQLALKEQGGFIGLIEGSGEDDTSALVDEEGDNPTPAPVVDGGEADPKKSEPGQPCLYRG